MLFEEPTSIRSFGDKVFRVISVGETGATLDVIGLSGQVTVQECRPGVLAIIRELERLVSSPPPQLFDQFVRAFTQPATVHIEGVNATPLIIKLTPTDVPDSDPHGNGNETKYVLWIDTQVVRLPPFLGNSEVVFSRQSQPTNKQFQLVCLYKV